jgi:hypothetical protein
MTAALDRARRDHQVRQGRAHRHRPFGPGVTDGAVSMINDLEVVTGSGGRGWQAVVAAQPRI